MTKKDVQIPEVIERQLRALETKPVGSGPGADTAAIIIRAGALSARLLFQGFSEGAVVAGFVKWGVSMLVHQDVTKEQWLETAAIMWDDLSQPGMVPRPEDLSGNGIGSA